MVLIPAARLCAAASSRSGAPGGRIPGDDERRGGGGGGGGGGGIVEGRRGVATGARPPPTRDRAEAPTLLCRHNAATPTARRRLAPLGRRPSRGLRRSSEPVPTFRRIDSNRSRRTSRRLHRRIGALPKLRELAVGPAGVEPSVARLRPALESLLGVEEESRRSTAASRSEGGGGGEDERPAVPRRVRTGRMCRGTMPGARRYLLKSSGKIQAREDTDHTTPSSLDHNRKSREFQTM